MTLRIPPASSACPLSFDTGHTCTSTHAFASSLLQKLPRDNPLAIGYPSPPSGWVWTLSDICVINIKHHHLAAGSCPAHNKRINSD